MLLKTQLHPLDPRLEIWLREQSWLFRYNYLAFQRRLGLWVDMADGLNLCSNLAVLSWTGESGNQNQHFSPSLPPVILNTMRALPTRYAVSVGGGRGAGKLCVCHVCLSVQWLNL